MYQMKEREAEFPAIDLAFGGKLRKDNRWVMLADIIPWDFIEEKYASRMSSKNGRKVYSVRIALGACIIKEKLGISDEETVELIRENHYLQYFIGYEAYRDEKPFDSSMMIHFRKRLAADVLKELNELIIETEIRKQKERSEDTNGDREDPPASGGGTTKNEGTLIVDATCAPEAMRFPHDATTLDEARRKTERVIDILHEGMLLGTIKPRTYRKKARKLFLQFIRNSKPREKNIRRAIKRQLQFVERNLRSINKMSDMVGLGALSKKQYEDLQVIKEFTAQQWELYKNGHLEGGNRILSINKPHVRAIARGKARGMFEFGAKISVSLFQKFARVERLSWNNYNEGIDLIDQIEIHQQRYGMYPEVVCADKIYRNRKNLEYCKEHEIRLSGPKLGRPYKDEETRRAQRKIEREDEGVRVAIEGKFGEAKTRYTLDRIERRLKETSESAIMMVFLIANLASIMRSRVWDIITLLLNTFRMSEYLSGNDVESRTDWDPDQPRLTWKDTEYYHQDILGSVAALTDRYGVVRERYKYDAFGSQYEGNFQRINELGYNGKRYDGATGWYDYGFRDYEADVGRFTTVDPIRDGGNWYAYVENDPVNFVDPWGLSPSDRNVAADARAMEKIANAINENDRYRAVADKHLGETYVSDVNDCDIWVQKRSIEAGNNIAKTWGDATTNTVKDHMDKLGRKIQSKAELGPNIVFQNEGHTGIILVNPSGSVDVYHQGYNGPNKWNSAKKEYSSISEFEKSWSGTKSYWPQ